MWSPNDWVCKRPPASASPRLPTESLHPWTPLRDFLPQTVFLWSPKHSLWRVDCQHLLTSTILSISRKSCLTCAIDFALRDAAGGIRAASAIAVFTLVNICVIRQTTGRMVTLISAMRQTNVLTDRGIRVMAIVVRQSFKVR